MIRLADVLCGQLDALGPGVRAVSVESALSWRLVKVACAGVDAMRALAVDLELEQARDRAGSCSHHADPNESSRER